MTNPSPISPPSASGGLLQDTIAATATPPGRGGVAVVRISGPDALAVLGRIFRAGRGATLASPSPVMPPRRLVYGVVFDAEGAALDDVLAAYMPGPHSFTGEDVCEISCHGGQGVTAELLSSVLAFGARAAQAGEFTRRAFLNGRMDLTQAEAVAELIEAPTREGVRLARAKLEGALGAAVTRLREQVDSLRIQITLCVDFPEDDAELLSESNFARRLDESISSIDALLAAFDRARLWREGAQAVLAGSVNAGKSSLLNALLGRPRAIVSSSPGTTRDYIEESVNIKGLPLRVVDTAGLRTGGDLVEEEGIRRTGDLARQADLVLLVLDASGERSPEEADFLARHRERFAQGRLLIICNKVDALGGNEAERDAKARAVGNALCEAAFGKDALHLPAQAEDAGGTAAPGAQWPCFPVSAKEGSGLEALCAALYACLVQEGGADMQNDVSPNLRQAKLLEAAKSDLSELARAQARNVPADLLGVHLESAAANLAEVTGFSGTEELYDTIFSTFCIGK